MTKITDHHFYVTLLLSLILTCLISSNGYGTILRVPGDYSSIQGAIDIAMKCDTILVDHGTYNENIVLPDLPIVLGSKYLFSLDSSDIFQTVIIGSVPATITFENLIEQVELVGFTLTSQSNGGNDLRRIIYCSNASPVIRNNLITAGYARGFPVSSGQQGGGIIILNGAKPLIIKNIIHRNHAWKEGGGIAIYQSEPVISENLITENYSETGGGIFSKKSNAIIHRNVIDNNYTTWYSGGGILSTLGADTIENNTIVNNYTTNCCFNKGGGVYVSNNSTTLIQNNIFAWNTSPDFGKGLYCSDSSNIVRFNNFFGDTLNQYFGPLLDSTNLFGDPYFENPITGNYQLSDSSICIDAGNPDAFYNDAIDSMGTVVSPSKGLIRNDMGAFGGRVFSFQSFNCNVGIYQIFEDLEIVIYPNPAPQKFFMEVIGKNYGKLKLEIVDLKGRTILIQDLRQIVNSAKAFIDLGSITEGMYVIKVYNKTGGFISKKLLIRG